MKSDMLTLLLLRILNTIISTLNRFYQFKDAWVFLDRDSQADDNAEHMYRYVSAEHSTHQCYFLLRKSTHDWLRLESEGFNLVAFGSIRHMVLMFNAKHVISSHADNYVFSFPPARWMLKKKKYHYTFLQHGVIKDDLSKWLNKKPIDRFIVSTQEERQSIVDKSSHYRYTANEVRMTGLARHDNLLNQSNLKSKPQLKPKSRAFTLMIAPTWRESLVGNKSWMSNVRSINKAFYTSEYAILWKQFLHSAALKELIERYNLNIVFFPHANVVPYIEWFDVPNYITTSTNDGRVSIQTILVDASLLVTDYSSLAFEMAYIEKPVVYYQFDQEKVFDGAHLTKKGYYDYQDDGFGPVCENEGQLIKSIESILNNNCRLDETYAKRAKDTFYYRDEKCCQRIYESILELEA